MMFVVGCIKLTGIAKSMDMVDCLINVRCIKDFQSDLSSLIQHQFENLRKHPGAEALNLTN